MTGLERRRPSGALRFAVPLALVAGWALLEPYLLVRRDLTVRLPYLPQPWQGTRIAFMADLHVGMTLANTATIRQAVRRIIEASPALALIGGDFVHGSAEHIDEACELVRPLGQAGIPTYAVLGNHDYAVAGRSREPDVGLANELKRRLEAVGVRVLTNEAVSLDETRELYLVGLGPHLPHADDPLGALGDVPDTAARLVLMHHPRTFDRLPPGAAPVALAAHTHGGQVRLPSGALGKYLMYVKDVKVLGSGWIEDGRIDGFGQAGNKLFITRGIGMSMLPVRFACRPELTMIRLERAGNREDGVRK